MSPWPWEKKKDKTSIFIFFFFYSAPTACANLQQNYNTQSSNLLSNKVRLTFHQYLITIPKNLQMLTNTLKWLIVNTKRRRDVFVSFFSPTAKQIKRTRWQARTTVFLEINTSLTLLTVTLTQLWQISSSLCHRSPPADQPPASTEWKLKERDTFCSSSLTSLCLTYSYFICLFPAYFG